MNDFKKFFIFFLAMCFIALFDFCFAAAPFTDDFDSYSAGNLDGQGNWTYYWGHPQVSSDISFSAPNSAKFNVSSLVYARGSLVDDWALYQNLYFASNYTGTVWDNTLRWSKNGGGEILFNFVKNNENVDIYFNNYILVGSVPLGSWFVLGVKSGTNVAPVASINGNSEVALTGAYQGGIDTIQIDTTVGKGDWYLDNITDSYTPITIAGYAPVLTPALPVRNVDNFVDFDDPVSVSGLLEIPTLNEHSWNTLRVSFYKPNEPFPVKNLDIDVGDLIGGQSFSYSAI